MKFAHFADVHLGYHKSDALKRLERDAFTYSIDRCISDNVDFVLMCGDIFHNNIPDMRVQKMAMEQFRRLYDSGIPVYVVYGSHDFSPISNSVIDLFVAAGYMIKPRGVALESGNIGLEFITDPKTGAKIAGLGGLKVGRDRDYYENLERTPLESESGFKIFLFHGGITEMMDTIADDGMPVSLLPKGFDYYAGGHMHEHQNEHFSGYDHVVYPGTLFAGHSSDMENSAKGQRRGFVIVEFDSTVKSIDFIAVPTCEYVLIVVDADMQTSDHVQDEITTKITNNSTNNKVVILRIFGELLRGRTTDVDLRAVRQQLLDDGAIDVIIHRREFTSKEYDIRGEPAGTIEEVEIKTFQDNIKQIRMKRDHLIGDRGVTLAQSILSSTRIKQPDNETSADYAHRIYSDVTSRMELDV